MNLMSKFLTVESNGSNRLCDLVALGKVGVEVLLPVKCGAGGNVAAEGKPRRKSFPEDLII